MRMRPPSEYAPPDAPIRRMPIDLPDDFGTEDANRGDLAVTIIAGIVLLAIAIGAAVIIGALA